MAMKLASPTPKCFQCGSILIQISKIESHPEGSLFPQTTSIFRCSNVECQAQKDKDEAKRMKLQEEKNEADKNRASQRQKRSVKGASEILAKHSNI